MEYAESYVNTFTDDELSYRVSKRCIVFFAFLNFYGFLNFFRQRFFYIYANLGGLTAQVD